MPQDNAARRRRHWIFGGLAACAVLLAAWAIFHTPAAKPAAPPSIPVTVVKVMQEDIPLSITALGAAQSWTSVTILAQVSGKLLTVNFKEGSDVRKGDVLAQIDPAPYKAVVMQADGALKRDQALLANARLDLIRYQQLAAQHAIATQQVDTQAALVKQDEGVVEADQGTLNAAEVNLGWTRIVSPIDGRVGVRLVDPGNLVSTSGSVSNTPSTASSTNTSAGASTSSSASSSSGAGIVVVNQIEPIAVTFTVPEGDFQRLSDVSNGFAQALAVKVFSQESNALLDQGQLTIADNKVDAATGTVELKARFENSARHLWPGQFVNVQLTLQTLQHVVTIPVAAVNRGPGGNFAYVVGADKKVENRPLVLATTEGTTAIIKSGLKPGETVVTDGQMILKAGSPVRIVTPGSSAPASSGSPPAAGTASAPSSGAAKSPS